MIRIAPQLPFILLVFLTACTSITDPTLERIEDVEIIEITTDKLGANLNMILFNSNVFALDLASASIKVVVDDIELADVSQTYDAVMPARSEFKMPMAITMELSRLYKDDPLGAITKGLKIISERQLKVRLLGEIKAGKGRAKITVPIDQEELVQF